MSGAAEDPVRLELRGATAWITLNRPAALNAWTPALGKDLHDALRTAEASDAVRAVVLTGAGRAFSSGVDLRSGGLVDAEGRVDVLTSLRQIYNPVMLQIRTMGTPVIAAVNGVAAGIGCSLAVCADIVIAAESAAFLLAFARVGLALDGGASPLLVGRVGHARASELALLADPLAAVQALQWGLVNRVVPDGELVEAAAALADRLASGAPGSHASIKRTLNESAFPRLEELLELEAVLQQERAESSDFQEGMRAFVERRPAVFSEPGEPVD